MAQNPLPAIDPTITPATSAGIRTRQGLKQARDVTRATIQGLPDLAFRAGSSVVGGVAAPFRAVDEFTRGLITPGLQIPAQTPVPLAAPVAAAPVVAPVAAPAVAPVAAAVSAPATPSTVRNTLPSLRIEAAPIPGRSIPAPMVAKPLAAAPAVSPEEAAINRGIAQQQAFMDRWAQVLRDAQSKAFDPLDPGGISRGNRLMAALARIDSGGFAGLQLQGTTSRSKAAQDQAQFEAAQETLGTTEANRAFQEQARLGEQIRHSGALERQARARDVFDAEKFYSTPVRIGEDVITDPLTGEVSQVTRLGLPRRGGGFNPLTQRVERPEIIPKVGGTYNAPDGTYGRAVVKKGKVVEVLPRG